MESNSDKAMRNKLQGVEMPFDPAAWEQMEAMLNKDEKKRGFFWWWFGAGMAALLLLSGAGTYVAMHNGAQGGQLAVNTVRTAEKGEAGQSVGSRQFETVGNKESGVSNAYAEGNVVGRKQVNGVGNGETIGRKQLEEVGNEKGSTYSSTRSTSTSGNRQPTTGNSKKTRKKQQATGNRNASNNQQLTTGNSNISGNNKGVKHASTRNSQPATSNNGVLTDFNGKPIANTVNTGTASNLSTQAEAVSADKYWLTYLTPAPAENTMLPNESNTDLPKVKPKVFQYSIGALGHVSAALVKSGVESKGVTLGYKPSSMGGFTQDFLFANRFAISNSILYSQSHFLVKNPRSESFQPAPLAFNCKITELAIPIGIKVYAVAKPKVRFYVSAGIINHVKLTETFTYTASVVPQDTGNIPTVADVKNTYPTTTNFDGTGNGVVETTDASFTAGTATTTKVLVNTNEFSINNAKRYYASFYAGAGVEGIIKNKWILFAEPTFSMALQKIGIQERRKYNVGANLGFRYQF